MESDRSGRRLGDRRARRARRPARCSWSSDGASRFLPATWCSPGVAVDADDAALAARWFGDPAEAPRAAVRGAGRGGRPRAHRSGLVDAGTPDSLDPVHTAPPSPEQLPELARWVAPDRAGPFRRPVLRDRRPGRLDPAPDGAEAARAWWASPRELLASGGRGPKLYWPTYATMLKLAACEKRRGDLLAAPVRDPASPITTRIVRLPQVGVLSRIRCFRSSRVLAPNPSAYTLEGHEHLDRRDRGPVDRDRPRARRPRAPRRSAREAGQVGRRAGHPRPSRSCARAPSRSRRGWARRCTRSDSPAPNAIRDGQRVPRRGRRRSCDPHAGAQQRPYRVPRPGRERHVHRRRGAGARHELHRPSRRRPRRSTCDRSRASRSSGPPPLPGARPRRLAGRCEAQGVRRASRRTRGPGCSARYRTGRARSPRSSPTSTPSTRRRSIPWRLDRCWAHLIKLADEGPGRAHREDGGRSVDGVDASDVSALRSQGQGEGALLQLMLAGDAAGRGIGRGCERRLDRGGRRADHVAPATSVSTRPAAASSASARFTLSRVAPVEPGEVLLREGQLEASSSRDRTPEANGEVLEPGGQADPRCGPRRRSRRARRLGGRAAPGRREGRSARTANRPLVTSARTDASAVHADGPPTRSPGPSTIEREPMALGVDQLHEERAVPDHPRVRDRARPDG